MALSRTQKPAGRRPKRTPQDLVLRITLEDIEPPIWREIALSDTTTLPELHRVIQLAFEWYDYHLHQFTIGAERYTIPDQELDDFGIPARSALGITLSQLGLIEGTHFTYEYDFGDSWTHRIEVRKISPAADRVELMSAPLLVDGRRSTPPEDCGGPPRYDELLRVLADPSDPEHADMHTWVGPDFDAERFDARAARHALIMAAVWEQYARRSLRARVWAELGRCRSPRPGQYFRPMKSNRHTALLLRCCPRRAASRPARHPARHTPAPRRQSWGQESLMEYQSVPHTSRTLIS